MLGPTIASYLPDLRGAAESMQMDKCTITRAGVGEGTFDPETGATTPPDPETLYTGACRFRAPTLAEQTTTAGEHAWTTEDSVLSVPVSVTGLQVDDVVTVTASQLDPDLPGTVHVVMAVLRGSQITARRLIVRHVSS